MARHLVRMILIFAFMIPAHVSKVAQDANETYPYPTSAPAVRVSGGTEEQNERLFDAVERFIGAGLKLPDLDVVFSDDKAQCNGSVGLFSPRSVPWTISICNRHITSVYLHELAHAWTQSHLSDETREAFMDLHGLETWNDKGFEWADRGTEVAAMVIQAGLDDPGLFEDRVHDQLVGFELLTGIEPPRLELAAMN